MNTIKIQFSKEIKIKIKTGYISTRELISFLITKGFDTSKDINKTALKDLSFDGLKCFTASNNNDYIILKLK